MERNRLKAIWTEGHAVLNGWCVIGDPFAAEIMAAQGFDSLTVDMQHGALDYSHLLPMLQAVRASGVTPLVRVPWRDPAAVMKALDAGALGIICPMVNSAAEAAEFASYMRYPPQGQRSWGPTRASVAMGGYSVAANDEVLAIAMIETARGVENLEEIVATPGIDGIYVGPADLTLASQGRRLAPGFDREEPEMVDLIRRILSACKGAGLRACLHCGTPDYAAKAAGWGFDLVTVRDDSAYLAAGAGATVARWRALTSP
jgi:4-hydroxy-2-oxoheptanedioate aldolase